MPLRIVIPASTEYDETTCKIYDKPERVLILEHSLRSISKWESITHKCFLQSSLAGDEIAIYVQCMSDEFVDIDDCRRVAIEKFDLLNKYIFEDKVAKKPGGGRKKASGDVEEGRFLPSEEIYYIMFERGIPVTCENWHFSRLLSLMNIYAKHDKKQKGGKGKTPMSPSKIAKLSEINRSRLNNGGS